MSNKVQLIQTTPETRTLTLVKQPDEQIHTLQTYTVEELLLQKLPPREHLLRPWLRQRESALIWSEPGLGKTFVSLSVALVLAGGGKMLNWSADGGRKVLIYDAEMDDVDLQSRLAGLAPGIDGLNRVQAGKNITITPKQRQHHSLVFPDLASPAGQASILKTALDGGFDVVIFDNLSSMTTVADENSSQALKPVTDFIQRMKSAGLSVITICHSNKGGTNYRGTSHLAGNFDVIIGLQKTDEALLQPDGICFKLTYNKYRSQTSTREHPMVVSLQTSAEDGISRWSHKMSEEDRLTLIVALLKSGEYSTQTGLAAPMKCNKVQIGRLRVKLAARKIMSTNQFDHYLATAKEAKRAEKAAAAAAAAGTSVEEEEEDDSQQQPLSTLITEATKD